jgi:hypothetical protein
LSSGDADEKDQNLKTGQRVTCERY